MTSQANGASGFQITVEPSGRSFTSSPGETILAAGIRAGVDLPYGCQDGACGSCKCKKLSGSVIHGVHQIKALSGAEEASGFVLTCCGVAHGDVVLESRQVGGQGAFAVRKMPVRVSLMERKSSDVMLLRLQLPAHDRFAYHAGQYIDFLLRDGTRRSYSMANAPQAVTPDADTGAGMLELHIRHTPGGKLTNSIFTTMKERDLLRIEGPFGGFYLREDSDKPIILLAAGTGFAPIKAIIEHMQVKGITRAVTLYWGGRRPLDLYMDQWVRSKMAEMTSLSYIPVVSDALAEDGWTGRTGFVHRAVLQDLPDLSAYQVYACGAPLVVDAARAAYLQAGLDADEFYADSFITEADKAKGLANSAGPGADGQGAEAEALAAS